MCTRTRKLECSNVKIKSICMHIIPVLFHIHAKSHIRLPDEIWKLFSRSRKQELPFSNGTVDIQNFQHWALVYFVPKYVGVVLWLDKGNFPQKICILCVCVKINVSLNLFVFGSRFRTLAVAVILFKISLPRYVSLTSKDTKPSVYNILPPGI